jgi:hypothetical protein
MPNGRRRALTRLVVVTALIAGTLGLAAPAFADPSVPDAPTNVRAQTGQSGGLLVSADVPADNGDPITGYSATCDSNDGGASSFHADVGPLTYVFGLDDGSTYTCTMIATNAQGDSTPSAQSNQVVVGAPGIDTVAASPGDGTIYVRTDEITSRTASPIQTTTAECTSSDGGAFATQGVAANAPTVTVSGVTNDKHYTCVMYAENGYGVGSPSLPSDDVVPSHSGLPPAPPAYGTFSLTRMDSAISVNFTPPDGGDDPPSNFEARCVSDDGGATGLASSGTPPIVVSSLDNGKIYSCQARAENDAGWSWWSDLAGPTTPGAVPDTPDQPTVVVVGNSAQVTYSAPADNGYAITDYTVTCTSSNGGVTRSVSGAPPMTVVFVLSGDKTYSCTVAATNDVGTSDPSDPSDPFDTDPATPDPPAKPTVTAHLGVLTVDTAPPWDGGDPITHYYASCTSSDGGNPNNNDGATLPIGVLADLGHTYTCTVNAENGLGTGSASPASDPILNPSLPATPDKPDVSANGTSITVDFDPPDDRGSAITSYTVKCWAQGGGADLHDDFASSPAVLTGATNGETYNCQLNATNGEGTSIDSALSDDVVIIAGAPDAPDAVVASPGDGSMRVDIDSGNDNGSAITGFDVSCVSSDGGTPGSGSGATSEVTVSGLDNGKTYTCTASETNAGGTSAGTAADPVIVGTPFLDGNSGALANDGSATVVFIGLAHENAGPIMSWTATCTSSDGGAPGAATGPKQLLQVTGLTNGKTYTCNMFATNAAGAGPPAIDSDPIIPGVYPPPPTDIVATRGNGEISLAFTPPPDDLGDPIAGYFAFCFSVDGGTFGQAADSDSPVVVTGLDNDHEYYCVMLTTHNVAFSSASQPVGPVMPGAVSKPDAPVKVVATPGPQRASVAFDPPADNGGDAITGYTATCVSSDGGVTGSVSGASPPLDVIELSGGKTYTCTVVATNSHGDSDASADSNAIVVLASGARPANTRRPTVSGSPVVQRTLTAHKGSWSGSPTSYAYQWQRCDNHGGHCSNITHATKRTYVLKNGDTDHTIRVRMTAHNTHGSTSRASKVTKVIRWIPMSISGPYFYNGTGVYQGGIFSVGAASHGNSVWTTYQNGYVLGPRFGPGDGTLVRTPLKKPIVSIVPTPTGRGYWMFAGDGGIFTFGDAHFYGSTGAKKLFAPIVSMAVTPNGKGYWLFAADGGVFAFGNAHFYGSTGGQVRDQPVVAMLSSPSGHGYWLITANGDALPFGDAPTIGNVKYAFRNDIVGIVSTGAGYRFVTKTLQLLTPR